MESLYTRRDKGLGDGEFDSVAWLCQIIGIPDNPRYKSAIVNGENEGEPQSAQCYAKRNPSIYDEPLLTWTAPSTVCECTNPHCPIHSERIPCGRYATATLRRADMMDSHSVRLCGDCTEDALKSGTYIEL